MHSEVLLATGLQGSHKKEDSFLSICIHFLLKIYMHPSGCPFSRIQNNFVNSDKLLLNLNLPLNLGSEQF